MSVVATERQNITLMRMLVFMKFGMSVLRLLDISHKEAIEDCM